MKKFEITFPLIWLILLLKPEFRAADYRAMLDKKDSAYPSGSDLNGSGGAGSNVNTNKGQEIEYWAHQHQWFETGKLTTATDSTSNSENLIPTFKKEANTSLITSAGQTVYLHCHVENLGERSVSWIRRSDLKILTIGDILYTQDQRFMPIHEEGSESWILKLTNPQVKDSGEYECQVSYHEDVEKKLTMPISLTVLDSRAYLHGSRDLHVQTGSKLTLSCAVKSSSGYPDYVYWYRNEDVLNYLPHVKIEDAKSPDEQPLVSKLSVENVQRSHTGNYTCAPSNARPASVMVHVVDDESGPAAMQHGNSANKFSFSLLSLFVIVNIDCMIHY